MSSLTPALQLRDPTTMAPTGNLLDLYCKYVCLPKSEGKLSTGGYTHSHPSLNYIPCPCVCCASILTVENFSTVS